MTCVAGVLVVNMLDSVVALVTCIPAVGGIGFMASGSNQGSKSRWGIPPKSQGFVNLGRGAGSSARL